MEPALTTSTRPRAVAVGYCVAVALLVIALLVIVLLTVGCDKDGDPRVGPTAPPIRFFHQEFLAREGIPVYERWGFEDVQTLALGAWPRLGGSGAYIRLYGHEGLVGAWVLELAPGERTKPERHIFDEIVYVLAGTGESQLWQGDAGERTPVRWQTGSLFSPPLNAWHEHVNTGTGPARLIAFTNAPLVLDFYRDARFVFENAHVFHDRWDGDPALFEPGPVRRSDERWPAGNALDPFHASFVPDVRALEPVMHRWHRKRGEYASFAMAGNLLNAHVSSWAAESYQTAHRHNAGATVLVVAGEGFHLMWPKGAGARPFENGHGDSVLRLDFRAGSVFSPPDDWYHMHLNTGATPAIYLAVTPEGRVDRGQFVRRPEHNPMVTAAERPFEHDHPELIGSDDEDPAIRTLFDEAVCRRQREGGRRRP